MPSSETGTVEAIWIKPAHGASMRVASAAQLVAGAGIVGNADQGGKRQITLIHRERWDAVARVLGAPVDPSVRRANVLVRGIPLAYTASQVLVLGACRIRVLGEITPCEVIDRAVPGLANALRPDWGGGAYGEVLSDGDIRVGDCVAWETPGAGTSR
jgi:MOSC domain-containing protein YiiM